MVFQDSIKLSQQGGGAYEITSLITNLIRESNIQTGTCQLFIHSSMASIFIADMADENTKKDTAIFLADLAPSNDKAGIRIDRGMASFDDDMKQVIVQNSISFPVTYNKPAIGVWQGIYLWDKNTHVAERKITVTVIGE